MRDDLLDKKINEILEMRDGVKVLLFDGDTKTILSNLIPYSRFLERDYFLFDNIENRGRKKIHGITCVVVIRPDNIKLLIEEISNPFYEQYIILFTNQIDPLILEILATTDTHCVISEVHEIYIDFFRQDEFLYTLHRGRRDDDVLYRRKRVIDGLFAFIMTLERIPTIKVQTNNQVLLEDAEILNNKLSDLNFNHGGTLIVLDRAFDLYTPLLYDWRYQGLLYEHLGYENGITRIGKKSYSMTNDSFFNDSKFKDIYEVSEDIKRLIKKVEVRKNRLHNLIFDDIEENARISQQVEAHLSQHGCIMKECLGLKDLSEMEMNILRENKVSRNEMDEYLLRKDIPSVRRSKLLMIYSLRNKRNMSDEIKRYPDLMRDIERFTRRFLVSNLSSSYGYRFDNDVDIKLGYQPPMKRILRHWWTDRLDTRWFTTIRESGNPKDFVIIYIRDGLTYSEYRVLSEYYQMEMENKSRLYIVCDSMVCYKDIMS